MKILSHVYLKKSFNIVIVGGAGMAKSMLLDIHRDGYEAVGAVLQGFSLLDRDCDLMDNVGSRLVALSRLVAW